MRVGKGRPLLVQRLCWWRWWQVQPLPASGPPVLCQTAGIIRFVQDVGLSGALSMGEHVRRSVLLVPTGDIFLGRVQFQYSEGSAEKTSFRLIVSKDLKEPIRSTIPDSGILFLGKTILGIIQGIQPVILGLTGLWGARKPLKLDKSQGFRHFRPRRIPSEYRNVEF